MGVPKWKMNGTLIRHIILIVAAMMVTSPAWADEKKTAEAIGWAIGCGCSRTDADTMIKYLGVFFFPNASEAKLKSLAGYVKFGENESRLYDNSQQICSIICDRNRDGFKQIDDVIKSLE